jgi:serine/threonine-protein kinase
MVPAATVMTQVVVAPLGRASTDGQIVVTTLEEAIRTASLVPEIETIEIDAERLESGPIKIPRSGLMIRGAASRPTVSLVFRQSNENIYRMQRPAMIETNGHKLRMEHLHLNWNLPTSAGDGGAMFRLLAGDSLALRDCSLTLENLSQREEVYGIEVVSDTPSSSFRDLTTVAKSTTIDLSSILARGEMSFINTPDAVPIGLRWNNGLLAVTGRLLETGGSDLLQSETAVAMRLRLTRVTLFGRGMVQVRAGPSGRNAPRIERICDSCVIVNQLSLAQIDLRNLPRMPDKVVPWLIAGENNLYENDLDPVVRVTTSTPMQKEWSFPEAQKELWYQERSPEFGIQWRAVAWPPDKPAYQLEASDFMQKNADFGFDAESPPPTPPDL